MQRCGWAWHELDRHALFKQSYTLNQRRHLNLLEMRRRQLRENPVRLHEAMQRVRTALYNAKTAAKIVHGRLVSIQLIRARKETAGDRLDGGKRVRKLMTQNAHEALPRGLLLFPQGLAHVGQQQKRVRRTVL